MTNDSSSTTTIRTYRYLFVFRFCLAVIHLRLNFELWNFSRPLDLLAAPAFQFITSAVLPAAAPAIPKFYSRTTSRGLQFASGSEGYV